jgi:protocatechuate 3,4-dioxygenase, alpha subunit
MPIATPWQTVGPFFHIGLSWWRPTELDAGTPGERVTIDGRVLDGDGRPVTDALVETWQADAAGRYAHPADGDDRPLEARFSGFLRVATDAAGAFRLVTLKPGRVPGPAGRLQAPHLVASIAMRGLLRQLVTRIYFAGEASNEEDPILSVVEPSRRATLLARPTGHDPAHLRWDVVLQGEGETVFLEW